MGYIQNRRKSFLSSYISPLDGYTAPQGAWSVTERLLSSYTGALCRVRRSSDNAEMDVSPLAATGVLDTATMLSWSGSDSVYVVTVYDQTSNARNFTQSTGSKQPRIANAGTVDTVNGLPVMNSIPVTAPQLEVGITYTGAAHSWLIAASLDDSSTTTYGRLLSCGRASALDYNNADCEATLLRVADVSFSKYRVGAVLTKLISSGTFYIATTKSDSSSIKIQADASTEVSSSVGFSDFNYTTVRLFDSVNTSTNENWGGKAGTLIYYQSIPSDISSVRDYLRTRYGTS